MLKTTTDCLLPTPTAILLSNFSLMSTMTAWGEDIARPFGYGGG